METSGTPLAGRSVIVTGAGRGLGAAYARHAAAAGASVVVNDVDGAEAENVAAAIRTSGAVAVADHHDIADAEQAAALIDTCCREFGGLDGLVNNAGVFHAALPHDEDPARVVTAVTVNLLGAMHCGAAALRVMTAARSGAIVNVTSGAQLGIPEMSTYGATKGGITALTYGWAVDLAAFGVRVNAVSPVARTRLSRPSDQSTTPPEAIAPLVTYLLSDAAPFTGRVLRLTGRRLSVIEAPREGRWMERESWDHESLAVALPGLLTDEEA